MKIYGYCRISTPKQNIQRQIDNITSKFPEAEIITEEYTGTKIDRPEWSKLYKQVKHEISRKENVTIVFDEVSRMSRNAEEGFSLYKELFSSGVNLVFLKEPYINTETYRNATKQNTVSMTGTDVDIILKAVNEYLMILAESQIKMAFESAQKEVDYLHKRTSEGVRRAKRNGKRVGTQPGDKLSVKKKEPIKLLITEITKRKKGLTDTEIIAILRSKKVMITEQNGTTKEVSAGLARNTYYKYKAELRSEGRIH
jgi:DNA invertase Pin-like site-specific DNA recombinase